MNRNKLNKCKACGKLIFNLEDKQIVCADCVPVSTNLTKIEYFNDVMLRQMIEIAGDRMTNIEAFELYSAILGCCCYYSEIIMGAEPRELLGRSVECCEELLDRMKINRR